MITEEQWKEVIASISLGLTNKDACVVAGIAEQSLYNKINSDRKEDLEFLGLLKKAKVKFKLKHLQVVSKSEHWQSSAWLLERKYKQEYGRLDIQMTVKDGLDKKTDEELMAELASLEHEINEQNKGKKED